MRYRKIMICFNLLAIVLSVSGRTSMKSYVVISETGIYKVKTSYQNNLVFENDDASIAIQWALDNIQSNNTRGGDVIIEAGTYPITNCLVIGDNTWLHGRGIPTKLIVKTRLREAIIIQDASMSVISGLSIINGSGDSRTEGILVERSVNCQVVNNHVSGFQSGIVNNFESALTLITGNSLKNNRTGINIRDGGGVIGRWLPLLITENIIDGGETGIYCNALCTNIIKNTIENLTGRGIVANHNSILVRENVIKTTEGDFAIWGNGQEFNCTDNIISNVQGGGIRTTTRWGVISNNTINNYGLSGNPSMGILVENDDNRKEGTVESKVIYNNNIINDENMIQPEFGIVEEGVSNVVIKNRVQNVTNNKNGLVSKGENTVIMDNTIK